MNKVVKELIPYVIIVVVVVIIRSFICTPVIVVGPSMLPTLKDKQILLLDKITYKHKQIKRFDIVVIKEGKKEIIKRVIGLPGEEIKYDDNKLYINGEYQEDVYNSNSTSDFNMHDVCGNTCVDNKIPDNYYLVLGDNRLVSADSRIIGLIPKEDILGRTNISIWPIKKIN